MLNHEEQLGDKYILPKKEMNLSWGEEIIMFLTSPFLIFPYGNMLEKQNGVMI
jgi:hypothetical protein